MYCFPVEYSAYAIAGKSTIFSDKHHTGIEPAFPVWKTGVLTIKRILHSGRHSRPMYSNNPQAVQF